MKTFLVGTMTAEHYTYKYDSDPTIWGTDNLESYATREEAEAAARDILEDGGLTVAIWEISPATIMQPGDE